MLNSKTYNSLNILTEEMKFDKLREECGIVGVWNHPEASNMTYLGLYALQHRGQEGAGVVSIDGATGLNVHRGMGLVHDVFHDFDFTKLPGRNAIGHVRYTTAGANILANVQPFTAELEFGSVAIGHNGNLINVDNLKKELIAGGSIFRSTSDTELFLHLMARASAKNKNAKKVEALISALEKVRGAYSLVVLFNDRLCAVRDPQGLRPLVLGQLNDSYLVASETCAFDLLGAKYIREIEPGEIVELKEGCEPKSYFPFPRSVPTPCVFEHIYFSRPDSIVYGKSVYQVRKALGKQLARECPVTSENAVVVPVLDSGLTAALGFSEESKLPLELGLIRNHYVGRTFIEPKQSIRDFGVKIKLNANHETVAGKAVILIDDSIVRGTTARKLIHMLRAAGATEVHFRVSSPPITDPCYYGIDTPDKDQLIAATKSVSEIESYLGVDSLGFLSIEGMYSALENAEHKTFCDACFSGKYPVGTPATFTPRQNPLLQV